MTKLFGKKIHAVHWIIMGGVLAIILLLLQYGYGGLVKTEVLSSRDQCVLRAREAKRVCYAQVASSLTACEARTRLLSNPARIAAELAICGQKATAGDAACRTQGNAAADACFRNTPPITPIPSRNPFPSTPPISPSNPCALWGMPNDQWCPGPNSAVPGRTPSGLCCNLSPDEQGNAETCNGSAIDNRCDPTIVS